MRHPKKLKYRNTCDVISIEGIEVDASSLWVFKNDQLVLVDDDQFVTHQLTDEFIKE
jgi:hypothetical protein